MMESDVLKLANYGAVGIAIIMIFAIVYIIKLILPIADKFRESIDNNSKVTGELADYIHMKNGDMAKVVDALCKEVKKLEKK